jgi:hypothetical protein
MTADFPIPTPLSNVPSNLNFLSPLGFKFIIKRAPHLVFFLHRCNIPGIKLPSIQVKTPFVDLTQSGDQGEYNDLIATFRVDEDMRNYLEMHAWMRNLGKMDNFDEYKSLSQYPEWTGQGLVSEIVLTVLDSSKNPNLSFIFHGCVPTNLSDLWFDVAMDDVQYLVATIAFDYDWFDYERHT